MHEDLQPRLASAVQPIEIDLAAIQNAVLSIWLEGLYSACKCMHIY